MKILLIVFTILITDFYYFPFETTFLPGVNTKMILAAIGLGLVTIKAANMKMGLINKGLFSLTLWALAISLISYAAITINNTNDPSYINYFISMWVWLAGAYTVTYCIKQTHGHLSVELLINYLVTVCTLQCTIALILDSFPALDAYINSYLTGEKFMGGKDLGNRLHGIGCALDVAAIRFSAVLIMIAYLLIQKREKFTTFQTWLYILSFITISIVGNMIGRTVTVGIVVALAYWLYNMINGIYSHKMLKTLGISLIILIPSLTIAYHTNANIRTHLRFGFEGFFSIYEKGHWETNSNNILKNMVVFPDNMKTWIIGDGYAANPGDTSSPYFDPYYTGKNFHGYYMQTDIGYLRFIFYFGTIGLAIFIGYFLAVGNVCMKNLPKHKPLFFLLLCINFLVWFKVSTDIFLAFAPFLCISKEEEEEAALEEREEQEEVAITENPL